MSYAGLGQISMIPLATVGRDPSRREAGGAVSVGARWAQRAVNAGNRYNNSSAPLIAVDGHAGPLTIGGLRTLSHQFSSDQPVTNEPSTSRVTDRVIIPVALEAALATKPIIADPPLSTATRRTTSSTTSAVPVTAPIPGATPAATPADEVILDEGSSGGGGLIARYGIAPFAIGGAVLLGVGLWFIAGGGMRANRRRRVRRNPVMSEWSRYVSQVGGHKRRRLSSVDAHAHAQRRAEEEGFSGRSGLASGWHEGRGMPGLGKTRRSRVQRNSSNSPFASSKGRRAWILAVGDRGDYLKSYDWNPGFGVADYAVTKSQRAAMSLTSEEAKSVAHGIGEYGTTVRIVQRGELKSNGRAGLWDLSLRGHGMSHRLGLPMSKALAKRKARHFRSQGYKARIVRAA